jgi:MFS family permease
VSAGGSDPRYGWTVVAVLAVTETVSWGVLYYAFAVFQVPMQHELGWSKSELTGAFSLALATSALVAFPVGRWLDRHSPRPLMTLGSVAGALLVLTWSRVHDLLLFYLVWAGIGLAMACVLYEAAFTVVTKWFRVRRRQALTAVTLMGGFASFVFSPLSNRLIDARGWRSALVTLAVVLAAGTVPLHAVFLRRAPEQAEPSAPALVPGDPPAALPERQVAAAAAIGSSAFWYLTAAFVLSSFAISAVAVHLIPYLLEGGRSAGFAALAAGLMGLMQVPGRVAFAAAARLLPRRYEAPAVFVLQGVGLAVLAGTTAAPGVVAAVCLFGMGNGMATLVRATTLADAYGSAFCGSIAGLAATCATAAGAYVAFNGYEPLLWLLVVGSLLAALSAWLAHERFATLIGSAGGDELSRSEPGHEPKRFSRAPR